MRWAGLKHPNSTRSAGQYYKGWRFLLFLLVPLLSVYIVILVTFSSSKFSSSSSPFSVGQISVSASLRSIFLGISNGEGSKSNKKKLLLSESRIAVCLVGGARRFELTGPSIIDNVLRQLPNSDLFLNSPMDSNVYKLSLLKEAPKIASVRIFNPVTISEEGDRSLVLTAANSPNGIQGLLQYFQMVEGCITLIKEYETQHNFTYDWIIRTRVDGYWSSHIESSSFITGHYVIPIGSNFYGLNDRFGIGDRDTSIVALSRLSLIPSLYSKGYRGLNSEASFKAQLTINNIPFSALDQPFCVVSDRKYLFPMDNFGVPVAAMSSPGPLNGVKCRPCKPACVGPCVAHGMQLLGINTGGWTKWEDGRLQLCDAMSDWEKGWEDIFDQSAGKRLAEARKRVGGLKLKECLNDFEDMRSKTVGLWDTPPMNTMCKIDG